MSLKTFHLIFIVTAILLAFGFGAWSILNYYSPHGLAGDLVSGIGSVVFGIALVVYERYFLKKTKNVSYL